MLEVRNRIREALIAAGFEFTGGGVNMMEPEADLDVKDGFDDYYISIKWRGQSNKVKS